MEQTSVLLLNQLHPSIRQAGWKAYAEAVQATPSGVHPLVTETMRTFERSAYLYTLGRTVVNPDGKSSSKPFGDVVSFSKGGQSYHNYGLALDFVILLNGKEHWTVDANWMIVVNIFKKHGFTWGGDFLPKEKIDAPHLELRPNNINWRDLLVLHNNKTFIPGTTYVKI